MAKKNNTRVIIIIFIIIFLNGSSKKMYFYIKKDLFFIFQYKKCVRTNIWKKKRIFNCNKSFLFSKVGLN